jgi:hypothetical protein
MSANDDDFLAPPAFKPAEALIQLKRQLRDLRLSERGAAFELKGRSIVELKATDASIEARLVKRPALTPEWTLHTLKNSADVRRFVDTVKQQLARWSTDE